MEEVRTKRLVLVDDKNRPRLVLEVTNDDKPTVAMKKGRLIVGDPNRGTAVEIDERGISVWGPDGNVVLSIQCGEEGGVIHLCDGDGVEKTRLP